MSAALGGGRAIRRFKSKTFTKPASGLDEDQANLFTDSNNIDLENDHTQEPLIVENNGGKG